MCDCHNETLVRTYVSSRSAAAHAVRVTRMLREAGRQASADAWASWRATLVQTAWRVRREMRAAKIKD